MENNDDNTKVRKAKLMTSYCKQMMENYAGQPREQMYYELWILCKENEDRLWSEAETAMIKKHGYQRTARIIDWRNWMRDVKHTWGRTDHVFWI